MEEALKLVLKTLEFQALVAEKTNCGSVGKSDPSRVCWLVIRTG